MKLLHNKTRRDARRSERGSNCSRTMIAETLHSTIAERSRLLFGCGGRVVRQASHWLASPRPQAARRYLHARPGIVHLRRRAERVGEKALELLYRQATHQPAPTPAPQSSRQAALRVQADKLHTLFFRDFRLGPLQLDELFTNLRDKTHDLWVWVAFDPATKLIAALQVGPPERLPLHAIYPEQDLIPVQPHPIGDTGLSCAGALQFAFSFCRSSRCGMACSGTVTVLSTPAASTPTDRWASRAPCR